jgi:alkyl hydroperoxide reductase subunit AhpF
MNNTTHPFDEATWAQLPTLLENLPEPVHIILWGDPAVSEAEKETAVLLQSLTDRFSQLTYQVLPRRINYYFYPVLGVMGGPAEAWHDFGVRLIGLPNGYAMTSFITAVQAVSFRGMTLEAMTRIKLKQLTQPVSIELFSAADNEAGALMAQPLFNMAVVNEHIRTFFVMTDQFPTAVDRYSLNYLPHMVINQRVHLEGVVDENEILRQIATAVKTT